MELNDKQIKDLVARRHPEYEKKKNIGTFSLAPMLAGVVGLAKIYLGTLKRATRNLRSELSVLIDSTTPVKW